MILIVNENRQSTNENIKVLTESQLKKEINDGNDFSFEGLGNEQVLSSIISNCRTGSLTYANRFKQEVEILRAG